jgi:hypothetical protein
VGWVSLMVEPTKVLHRGTTDFWIHLWPQGAEGRFVRSHQVLLFAMAGVGSAVGTLVCRIGRN